MPICYMTIGNVGEGKSTWARDKAYKDFTTLIISRDSLREMVFGQYGFKNEVEPLVRDMSFCNAAIALRQDYDVILDETFLSRDKRIEAMTRINVLLTENNYLGNVRFVYIFFGSSKNGLEKRMKDPRNVPPERWIEIWTMLDGIFEKPSYDEGVNEIVDMRKREDVIDELKKYAKKNKLPFVMPETYMCPSCNQSFRHLVGNEDSMYITSCPICNYSFLGG